jgi:hypothetical protein
MLSIYEKILLNSLEYDFDFKGGKAHVYITSEVGSFYIALSSFDIFHHLYQRSFQNN